MEIEGLKRKIDMATQHRDSDIVISNQETIIAELEARIAAARVILDGAPYSPTITEALAALEGTK